MNLRDKNVSIVSQIGLIFVSNCLKKISILSQTCLGQNVSIWSQFETFLTFWDTIETAPYLRAIWEQFETFFCVVKKGVKKVSNMSQKGIWGI